MSTALVPSKPNGQGAMAVFDPDRLGVALKNVARESGTDIATFLRMTKSGAWIYGADGTEVGTEETFLLDPRAVQHGYIAWQRKQVGNKLGEMMGPVTEPVPPVGEVPQGSDGWQFQLGLGLVHVDTGTPMIYRATSVGGRRAIGSIAQQMGTRVIAKNPECVPIITLESSSYDHREFGEIWNPIFNVQGWTTMEDLEQAATGGEPQQAPQPAQAPKKPLVRVPATKSVKPEPVKPGKAPVKPRKGR